MMETDTGGTGISIYVPITGTDEAVAVSVDHLPENVDEVLGILQAELAPLGLWLDFAKAYLQRGKEEQFRAILESGCSPGERKPGEPCGSARARWGGRDDAHVRRRMLRSHPLYSGYDARAS